MTNVGPFFKGHVSIMVMVIIVTMIEVIGIMAILQQRIKVFSL